MANSTHYRIAIEFGFPTKYIQQALDNHKFEDAASFIDFLETHEKEFNTDEVQVIPPEMTVKRQSSLLIETLNLYRQSKCLVCMKKERCFVTLPCCHFSLCENCEPITKLCPYPNCRQSIECSIKTYLA